jgi:hypothetical protein
MCYLAISEPAGALQCWCGLQRDVFWHKHDNAENLSYKGAGVGGRLSPNVLMQDLTPYAQWYDEAHKLMIDIP